MLPRIATLQDVCRVLCLYAVGFLTLASIVAFLPPVFCWMHICWIVVFFLYVIMGPVLLDPKIRHLISRLERRKSERLELDLVDWK